MMQRILVNSTSLLGGAWNLHSGALSGLVFRNSTTNDVRKMSGSLAWARFYRAASAASSFDFVGYAAPSWRRYNSDGHHAVQLRSFRTPAGQTRPRKRPRKRTHKMEEKQQSHSQHREEQMKKTRKLRMRNLHKAAKMKRILSQCDYWFSRNNLATDTFLKEELRDYAGHVPLTTIASFPKLEYWGDDPRLIFDTLKSQAAKNRYNIIFNQGVMKAVEQNRRRRRQSRSKTRKDLCSGSPKVADEKTIGILEKLEAANELLRQFGHDVEDEHHVASIRHQSDTLHMDRERDEYEPPTSIVDDESSNLEFALVRPKKVKLHEYFDKNGDMINVVTNECKEGKDRPSNPVNRYEKYFSNREVYVVENAQQLVTFCHALVEKSGSNAAIGFDVEYCRLNEDIRGSLPAMLTLASSDPMMKGIVGLIWLDKFPNHGKDMHIDPECQELMSILSNPSISKIGVGVSRDAKHLASWWGIDSNSAKYFFSGMVDMAQLEDLGEQLQGKSLQEMCQTVLARDLPKIKERGARENRERRVRGKRIATSHWRCDTLTDTMKQYAADDASSAIDIWNKIIANKGSD
eukprot:CAMPEP_0183710686 /NCGR_PEP_ID=MMETSP0737-20130205/6357_1 /TAXON_ID=385413 /ORGANISM="Thalassiosira miniscula, Strain CCMP1093" /LENGTH=574 /DNA_ID=CAMNT_0025939011 /DNA_START=185 /DNA_END=1909 /DNA_ORIENTATION=+